MQNRQEGKISVLSAIGCGAIVSVVVAFALPLFQLWEHGGSPPNTCIMQLNQIGKAIMMYRDDWDDKFAVNRSITSPNIQLDEVALSDLDRKTGRPVTTFQHGINWVEALNPYQDQFVESNEHPLRVCPTVLKTYQHDLRKSAASSYAFNQSLTVRRTDVRFPGQTMMVREMDRPCGAVCRPLCDGKGVAGTFLTDSDPVYGRTNSRLHMEGSNILFADGHTKTISSSSMPADDKLFYDKAKDQWWDSEARLIAITP